MEDKAEAFVFRFIHKEGEVAAFDCDFGALTGGGWIEDPDGRSWDWRDFIVQVLSPETQTDQREEVIRELIFWVHTHTRHPYRSPVAQPTIGEASSVVSSRPLLNKLSTLLSDAQTDQREE